MKPVQFLMPSSVCIVKRYICIQDSPWTLGGLALMPVPAELIARRFPRQLTFGVPVGLLRAESQCHNQGPGNLLFNFPHSSSVNLQPC